MRDKPQEMSAGSYSQTKIQSEHLLNNQWLHSQLEKLPTLWPGFSWN